jgi:hypothetical protein
MILSLQNHFKKENKGMKLLSLEDSLIVMVMVETLSPNVNNRTREIHGFWWAGTSTDQFRTLSPIQQL